jgi:hypothetical protein
VAQELLHETASNECGKKAAASPVVIGGMVLDIQATPSKDQLMRGTTTPGQVNPNGALTLGFHWLDFSVTSFPVLFCIRLLYVAFDVI